MTRFEYTENARAMLVAMNRDPVEAAIQALASLSQEDRERAISRFNLIFEDVETVPALIWT